MAKIRCPKCKRFTSVPFRKGVSTCQWCSAYLFFNPERPFFNAGFLLFLVLPFIPLIVELTSSPIDFKKVLAQVGVRSEEHTSELQSLMRISYAVFCLKKKKDK